VSPMTLFLRLPAPIVVALCTRSTLADQGRQHPVTKDIVW
jgi:hypothetical protein